MPRPFLHLLVFGMIFFTMPFLLGQDEAILRGRILADIDSLHHETGTSERYQLFVFGVETKGDKGKGIVAPVLIMYSYGELWPAKKLF
jgi:hypothetical protein